MSEKKADIRYSKDKLCSAEKYQSSRDLLNALLGEDKTYTIEQIEKMIKKYKERKM